MALDVQGYIPGHCGSQPARVTMNADKRVLIYSGDAMAAALVAALVESDRFTPAFAREGESADQAIERVRPVLAILVDALTDAARSELFLARASSRDVAVAAFCRSSTKLAHAEWSLERNVPVFGLPDDVEELRRWLAQLAPGVEGKRTARGAPRRALVTKRETDDTLVLLDDRGVLWSVYDRRSADRRTAERHFVNAFGEDRACQLDEAELAEVSADALRKQLARALEHST